MDLEVDRSMNSQVSSATVNGQQSTDNSQRKSPETSANLKRLTSPPPR
jgi:hypothetical protein